jgi:hypothetical protein
MRVISFLKFYVVAISALFILYSFINLTAVQKIFLTMAFTLLSPRIFREVLKLRGVRKGDAVLISHSRESPIGSFVRTVPGRALEGGKRGDAIEVEYGSERAVGEIVGYGGLFFPAEVNIMYYGGKIEVEVEE